MKVLFAIQGTGNGHLSRARDIIPILQKKVDLDILVSGIQADVELGFPIKHKLNGLSFIFGQKGGVDLWKTLKKSDFKRFRSEIQKINITQYQLVINDFEPVSAWAAKIHQIPCISLSHQAAVQAKESIKPLKKDFIGERILKHYAPTNQYFGFHFKRYNNNIYTPVIREEIRALKPTQLNHYTVYLPAYGDQKLIDFFSNFSHTTWHVFSKHSQKKYQTKNVIIEPVNNKRFLKSFESCTGILCGAGFETPAEALFLNKKLMVIPMKNQYEQQCNAAALQDLKVPVIDKLKLKNKDIVQKWLNNPHTLTVNYPNETEQIIDLLLQPYITLFKQNL